MNGMNKTALIAAALAFLGGQALAGPGTYNVNCSSNKTIGDAIADGAVEIVVMGTCIEYVTVDSRTLTIRGAGGVGGEIVAPTADQGTILTVIGGTVTISDLTLRGGHTGLLVRNGGRATITDSVVENNRRTGVRARESGTVLVFSSTIRNNGKYGIEIERNSSATIGGDSTEPPYLDNELVDNRSGIRVYRNAFATVGHNSIRRTAPNNFVGISVGEASAVKLDLEPGEGPGLFVSGYNNGMIVENGGYAFAAFTGPGITGSNNSVHMQIGATMLVGFGNFPDGFSVSWGSTLYVAGSPEEVTTSGISCFNGGRVYGNAAPDTTDPSCYGP